MLLVLIIKNPGFHLRLDGQRNVDGHLVTVKIRVERRAHQWMELNGLSFDENRLKCLDAQSVKCRRTVEQALDIP